jgi:hypothetical protein
MPGRTLKTRTSRGTLHIYYGGIALNKRKQLEGLLYVSGMRQGSSVYLYYVKNNSAPRIVLGIGGLEGRGSIDNQRHKILEEGEIPPPKLGAFPNHLQVNCILT